MDWLMKNFKYLKEQIEKLAQVPPRSKGNKTIEAPIPNKGIQSSLPSRNVGSNNSSQSFHSGGIPAVKNMQLAMQELAREVIKDSTAATMGLKLKDETPEQASDSVKKSKKAFNDFIAEQYIGSLKDDQKGVEWSSHDHFNTKSDKHKTQTDIYELDAVMNTLSRIGSEKSELNPDGVWGFRTDNALRNILGFTYALLQLEGDFGLTNNIYPPGNWEKFKQLLSGYKVENGKIIMSPEDKINRASEITKHLQLITKLYNQFRKEVTARPEFRPFIEGQRDFDKYPSSQPLDENDANIANSSYNNFKGVSYVAPALSQKKLDYIPLKALTSKEEYLKWMTDHVGLNKDYAIKVFNNVIKPTIEAS